ncbi:SDR family oxidoreductase [Pikeienuella piscinae]|uniref:SDR family oxidoreductase n=1 Tax=Pikeienuella piscinae TaxID=2748098 RepID=A0A7L5BVX4_9RHOB|nr:SDR family NAD(P)-dependent oxidoreductase [Pikeienuella piscinae]QIE56015.1 SDR family oxidoreductase [Pikeienuella piscinae]
MRFSGKTVLVTGAGGGIGRGMALGFAAEGAKIHACDTDADSVAITVAAIASRGGEAKASTLDVSDELQIDTALSDAEAEFGAPHVLVHCAAVNRLMPILETPAEEWRRIVDVNLTGSFLIARAAAQRMIPNKFGRIVLISSNVGFRGAAQRGAYAASKAGVINFAETLAIELADKGITVNTIAPGPTETPMTAWQPPEIRRALIADVPLGRYGRIDEMVFGALFLASDEASYITAHTLSIDGGFAGAGIIKPELGAEQTI